MVQTFFAPAERDDEESISKQVALVSRNPVIDGVLNASGGVIAVLNERRQILAVNDTLFSYLGVENPEELFGFRPGEVLNCVHAYELKSGCGTSSWCSSCGAAIAIVTSLNNKKPNERKCIMTAKKGASIEELCFSVHTTIVHIENRPFVLLHLQDITADEHRAAFERMYNHDLKNLLTGITCTAEMLDNDTQAEKEDSIKTIKKLCLRLRSEIVLHASFSGIDGSEYPLVYESIQIIDILDELKLFFKGYQSAKNKMLETPETVPDITFHSDCSLVLRVLTNLLINAFESSTDGETVKILVDVSAKNVEFTIWSAAYIKPETAKKVFQQYFSTKKGSGRGFGTFGSKYMCEKLLKGTIGFETSESDGTFFKVGFPRLVS